MCSATRAGGLKRVQPLLYTEDDKRPALAAEVLHHCAQNKENQTRHARDLSVRLKRFKAVSRSFRRSAKLRSGVAWRAIST